MLGMARILTQVTAVAIAWVGYVMSNHDAFVFLGSLFIVWLVVTVLDRYRRKRYADLIAWEVSVRTKGSQRFTEYMWVFVSLAILIPLLALAVSGNSFAAFLSYADALQLGILPEAILALRKYAIPQSRAANNA